MISTFKLRKIMQEYRKDFSIDIIFDILTSSLAYPSISDNISILYFYTTYDSVKSNETK